MTKTLYSRLISQGAPTLLWKVIHFKGRFHLLEPVPLNGDGGVLDPYVSKSHDSLSPSPHSLHGLGPTDLYITDAFSTWHDVFRTPTRQPPCQFHISTIARLFNQANPHHSQHCASHSFQVLWLFKTEKSEHMAPASAEGCITVW